MEERLSKLISIVFHPAIYPLLGLYFIFEYLPYHYPNKVILLSLVMVFCGTYLIPVLVSLLLYRFGLISSLMMEKASDRRWPYVAGALCFYLTARLIESAGLAAEAHHYLLGAATVILLHLILLPFLKPSAHLGGLGGFLGLFMAVSAKYALNLLPFIGLLILVAGIIASARLKLKAHNGKELLLGFFSGVLIVFATVYYLP
jgi:membrane-associated phospholipid phosphatase